MNKRILSIILSVLFLAVCFYHTAQATVKTYNEKVDVEKEVHHFIPYKSLEKLFNQKKNLIYLPYKELKRIIESRIKPQPKPPVNYAIKSIKLDGTIVNDHIVFEGDIKIDKLSEKWAYINFLSTDVNLKQVFIDGKQAPIAVKRNWFVLTLKNKGERNLKMKFNSKINTQGINSNARFSLDNVPISKIQIKYPRRYSNINISGASGLKTSLDRAFKITEANLTNNKNISLTWKNEAAKIIPVSHKQARKQKIDKPTKIISESNVLITVDEGLLQGFNRYDLQVYYKPIEKLSFKMPNDIQIISVSGNKNIVKRNSFKIIEDKYLGKVLEVYFSSKVKGRARLNIAYEKSFEHEKVLVDVPNLELIGEGIDRTSGYMVLQSAGNSEIKTVKTENISTVDVSDIPRQLDSLVEYPIISAHTFIIDDYDMQLEVIPHKDAAVQVAVADNVAIDSRLSTNGILTSKAVYKLRNSSEQYFRFSLPQNVEILTALLNGIPTQIEASDSDEDYENIYLVSIKDYEDKGAFNLAIMYRQKLPAGIFTKVFNTTNFIQPRVINMPILTTSWSVFLPGDMNHWYFTSLIKGRKYYSSYITAVQSASYSLRKSNAYPGKKQSSNFYDKKDRNEGKVVGILPPEFSMPPENGLQKYAFSGYLSGDKANNILFISVSGIINSFIFIVLIYFGWIISACIKSKVKNPNRKALISKLAIMVLPVYIIGLNSALAPLLIGGLAYFINHKFLKTNKN